MIAHLWSLLPASIRRQSFALLLLSVLATALELLSLGLVVPVITLLLGAGEAAARWSIPTWLPKSAAASPPYLLWALFALVLAFALKAIFVGWLGAKQSAFSWAINRSLSNQLYAGYLRQPWLFHLRRNSADLIRNTLIEVQQITASALALQQLMLDGLTLLAITLLLLWIEPIGAAAGLVFTGGMALLFQGITRRRLSRWGHERQQQEGSRLQHAQQSLASAREIRVAGVAPWFVAEFERMTEASARAGQRRSTLQQWPRLWMEWIAVFAMAATVATMALAGRSHAQILAALALFGAAAFRLLPVVTRVLGGLQTLRFGEAAIRAVAADLASMPPAHADDAKHAPLTLNKAIRFEGVGFRYPDADHAALDSIDLEIARGGITGIFGHSGAGKSTLVDLLLGLLPPSTGRLSIDGLELGSDARPWQRQIGYVPQQIGLLDDSLRRNIAFGIDASSIDDNALRRAVHLAQLDQVVVRLPQGLDTAIGERGVRLSGGERQRVGLARALYRDPAILVLDEATSALDPGTEAQVMDALRDEARTRTLILIAHRVSTLRYCDQLIHIEGGRVVARGTPQALFAELAAVAADHEENPT